MKTVRRLEVLFGFLTLVMASLNFFFFVIPSWQKLQDKIVTIDQQLFWSFVFLVIPALLVTIGAYLHAVKQRFFGLVILLFFGGAFVLLYAISFFLPRSLDNYIVLIIKFLPGLFAFITIILALTNTNWIFNAEKKLS